MMMMMMMMMMIECTQAIDLRSVYTSHSIYSFKVRLEQQQKKHICKTKRQWRSDCCVRVAGCWNPYSRFTGGIDVS